MGFDQVFLFFFFFRCCSSTLRISCGFCFFALAYGLSTCLSPQANPIYLLKSNSSHLFVTNLYPPARILVLYSTRKWVAVSSLVLLLVTLSTLPQAQCCTFLGRWHSVNAVLAEKQGSYWCWKIILNYHMSLRHMLNGRCSWPSSWLQILFI